MSRSSPVTETVTGSWSNDRELIALCMDMLGDVPGETLDQRVEKLVNYYLELQLLHGNEVQRSLNLEMELNQRRRLVQKEKEPRAYWVEHPNFGMELSRTPPSKDAIRRGWIATPLFALSDTSTDQDDKRARQIEHGRKRPAQNNPDGYPPDSSPVDKGA